MAGGKCPFTRVRKQVIRYNFIQLTGALVEYSPPEIINLFYKNE